MAISLVSSATNAILLSWGWRRAAIALSAGALSALAMPPFSIGPVLWITIPVLVLLLDGVLGESRLGAIGSAAFIGWLFGFGYFLAGLWWIGSAFLVEAEDFAWMMPFAVAAMPAGLALFWACAAALARLLWSEGPGRLFALAASFAVFEYLRGTILTGFPWNAPGYALALHDVPLQAAALTGLHGMTLMAFVVFGAPILLLGSDRDRVLRIGLASVIGCAALGIVVFGIARLAGAGSETLEDVRVRIVQPNIAQAEKWKPQNRAPIFQGLLDLSAGGDENRPAQDTSGDLDGITHLIWPETALPFLLAAGQTELGAIASLLPDGTHLVTGAMRVERLPDQPRGGNVYNSIYVFDSDGTIDEAYDKTHLVPFGEYLPFQSLFDRFGLAPLAARIGGFTAGRTRTNLTVGAAPPAMPLICYEAIFPGLDGFLPDRPGWLLNVTNDAWFGSTPGPYQHFHQARMRTVEQGLPMVRAANTGLSAIIDPYGRVRESLGLNQRGIVTGNLPTSLPPTIFARYGHVPFAALVAICLVLALLSKGRRFSPHG